MGEKKRTAIILAAGSGSRMRSQVAKQFLELGGKPLIYYSLRAVEQSDCVDDCILVTGEEDIPRVREQIVERYGFHKVKYIIAGGGERYASVLNARNVLAAEENVDPRESFVFVHDGARPFLTEEILERTLSGAVQNRACVAAMPSKDTVKIVDEEGYAVDTPNRRQVWSVQTPQVFDRALFLEAYAELGKALALGRTDAMQVTDDATVVELFTTVKVKLVEGSYQNIKITTPEDMKIARAFLDEK